jgi:hypothetical protein
MEPLRISNIDMKKLVYPTFRTNQKKKIILIKYNDNGKLKNFVFQTPTLTNINKPVLKNGFYELDVALEGKEKNKTDKFINFINNLENQIKNDAKVNASTWFNINNNQVINFQKVIRDSDDYDNGIIKLKIIKNSDFETVLHLNNNRRINVDNVIEDSWVKSILEIYGIWVNSNNDFGIFIRPVLISFTPKEKVIYNYKFLDDSEEEFDIPDTDLNDKVNDIFIQNNLKSQNNNNSTTQLEFNDLVKQLETDKQSDCESIDELPINNKNDQILNIDLEKYSNSDSTDSTDSTDSNN